jgi:hypothetical protein
MPESKTPDTRDLPRIQFASAGALPPQARRRLADPEDAADRDAQRMRNAVFDIDSLDTHKANAGASRSPFDAWK